MVRLIDVDAPKKILSNSINIGVYDKESYKQSFGRIVTGK